MNKLKTNKIAFWAVATFALLFSLWGAYNGYCYFTSSPEDMVAKMTSMGANEDQAKAAIDFFNNLPFWYDAVYAISLIAGVLATASLLARKKWAEQLYLVSLVTMVIAFISDYALGFFTLVGDMQPSMASMMAVTYVIITAIATFLYWWAKKLVARGDLS
ncbi:MAG: hypothetical protein QM529_03790 [Hydrotalea sp.]|nr:hypothetical protein [Hydrotalea sp.]